MITVKDKEMNVAGMQRRRRKFGANQIQKGKKKG